RRDNALDVQVWRRPISSSLCEACDPSLSRAICPFQSRDQFSRRIAEIEVVCTDVPEAPGCEHSACTDCVLIHQFFQNRVYVLFSLCVEFDFATCAVCQKMLEA